MQLFDNDFNFFKTNGTIEMCLFYLNIIKYFYKNCTDKEIHYTVL